MTAYIDSDRSARRVAIVGTGIAGNVAAYLLRDRHDITVYEASNYVGGHTNTIDVYDPRLGREIAVDTGFIVFNDRTYPEFNWMLNGLGQRWRPTEMSFSVRDDGADVEYNGATLNTLFAQRRNLMRPSFHRMVRDILRFNREATSDAAEQDINTSLGDYLRGRAYSSEFQEMYLVPMAAAIWSAEPARILQMPLRFLVRFFHNHGWRQPHR